MTQKVLPEERVPLLKRALADLGYVALYFDLETSPCEGYFWDTGEQYINYKQIKKGKETKIITIQYMFEGEEKPDYLIWQKDKGEFNDKHIVEYFINKVMRKYPTDKLIMIGQNSKAFDHKVLNQRAKRLRVTPPVHNIIKIDTYKASKQSFKAPSHSLDARSEEYGLGGKLSTNMQMWVDILEGRKDPREEMVPYGVKDVLDLRTIFWNDLPYYEKLDSNLERIMNQAKAKCPDCEVSKKAKYNIEPCKVNSKNGFRCLNCDLKFTL